VKIENMDIQEMINIKNKYNIAFLSPKINNSTHNFMNTYNNNISINNFLEIYCLLLTPNEMKLFFSLHSIQNKWMWGVDFMFGHFNIKTGVIFKYRCKHFLSSKSQKTDANNYMIQYLKKYNYTFKKLCQSYTPIKTIIKYP
jgi:hypothetical protein